MIRSENLASKRTSLFEESVSFTRYLLVFQIIKTYDMINFTTPLYRTNITLVFLQDYTKSPPKKIKKEMPERERIRNSVPQDTDISPTAMLDQT